jgi:hypothetical protein
MVPLRELAALLQRLIALDAVAKRSPPGSQPVAVQGEIREPA